MAPHAGEPAAARASAEDWSVSIIPAAAAALLSVAGWAHAAGCGRFDLVLLEGTNEASQIRRAGFVARADVQPIVILPLGGGPLPPAREWHVGRHDGSAT